MEKESIYIYVCVCILFQIFFHYRASPVDLLVKNPPAMQETQVQFLKICWRRDRLPLQYSWASQGGAAVNNLLANAGGTREEDLIPGSGRAPGVGNGNLLQYCCLKNPMDREAWLATVHRVAKSRTQLSDFTFQFFLRCL